MANTVCCLRRSTSRVRAASIALRCTGSNMRLSLLIGDIY